MNDDLETVIALLTGVILGGLIWHVVFFIFP